MESVDPHTIETNGMGREDARSSVSVSRTGSLAMRTRSHPGPGKSPRADPWG